MQYASPPAIGFPWRFVIYGGVALYLLGDLHFCHGPLRRHIESRRNPPPEAVGPLRWVASINDNPITVRELDRAVKIYLWKRGKTESDVSGQNLTLIRLAVREEMIARDLISTYAALNPVEVDPAEAEREYRRFRSRLDETEDDYNTRLELQGLTEARLRNQIADELQETEWIDAKTASAREVTKEKAREWFDTNREKFVIPERIRAAHIFRVTHGSNAEEIEAAGQILREAKDRILAGEITFEKIAAEISEDERTKKNGGDLGYFSKRRLPSGFTAEAFGQKVGVLGNPYRSEIGWHLVRVDERLPERPAKFEEVESEIRSFLESENRRAVVEALIKERRGRANVRLFPIEESSR